MKTFQLSCAVTVSAYTEVTAESLEEAIAIAQDRDMVVGGIHMRDEEKSAWIVDDIDGSPTNIHEA